MAVGHSCSAKALFPCTFSAVAASTSGEDIDRRRKKAGGERRKGAGTRPRQENRQAAAGDWPEERTANRRRKVSTAKRAEQRQREEASVVAGLFSLPWFSPNGLGIACLPIRLSSQYPWPYLNPLCLSSHSQRRQSSSRPCRSSWPQTSSAPSAPAWSAR